MAVMRPTMRPRRTAPAIPPAVMAAMAAQQNAPAAPVLNRCGKGDDSQSHTQHVETFPR